MTEDHKPHDVEHDPVTPADDAAADFAASEADAAPAGHETAVQAAADGHEPSDAHSEPVETLDETPDDLTEAAPEPDTSPGVEAIPAAAAVAAASVGDKPRPVWSDDGDAPFDDLEDRSVKTIGPIKADRRSRATGSGGSAANEGLEIVKTIVFALLIAFVLRVLLFQPFTIPSASMEPNLYEGDYIVVSKWSYGYSKYSSGLPINLPIGEGRVFDRTPDRGDIVVFKLPRDNKTDYIKRLIGLPGDRVQMIANTLYINGVPVKDVVVGQAQIADMFGPRPVTRVRETLPNGKTFQIQDFGPNGDVDDTAVYVVPEHYYFMMGDNRDNSVDSRYDQSTGVGLVPEENLVGKAQIIMFSWQPGASLFNPVSWFSKIRLSRFFHLLD